MESTGTKISIADTAEAAAPTATTTEETEQADPAATAPPLSIHDYSCPICLELLLRPVKLSCGHHFCRGCWVRVLQSRDGRAAANTTGSAACPFRCEVRPVVPEVDQALASELEALFGVQYMERTSSAYYALPEEERKAAEVNAWAAAGCALDTPEEDTMRAGAAATARRQLRTQRVHRVVSLLLAAAMSVGLYALLALVLVDEALNAVISTFLPDITNETLPLGIMLENYSSTALQPNDSAY